MVSRYEITRRVVTAWGRILAGYRPNLSIEITRECPLRCPGCYAYGETHLGGDVTLRGLADFKGDELVRRFLALVDQHKPLNVYIVGGEPLVRFRELNQILPVLSARKILTQVVTSAVRPIPLEWRALKDVQIVVSIDGLAAEHDVRRAPATYDRILRHIEGHQIIVHCTLTRQQVQREGYIEEFIRTWQDNPHTRLIWISLYTPQIGEVSAERLTAVDRARAIAELRRVRTSFSKLQLYDSMLKVYAQPPVSPEECTFARTTECVSADLNRRIVPCQFGGTPDCANCGCLASAGLEAIARHRLGNQIPVGRIFSASVRFGDLVAKTRRKSAVASR